LNESSKSEKKKGKRSNSTYLFYGFHRSSRADNTLPILAIERGIGFTSWGQTKSMTSSLLLLGDEEMDAVGGGR
jgi:hypothetical protein